MGFVYIFLYQHVIGSIKSIMKSPQRSCSIKCWDGWSLCHASWILINQSINQAINQPVSRTSNLNQLTCSCIELWFSRIDNHFKQTNKTNQPTNQSINQLDDHSSLSGNGDKAGIHSILQSSAEILSVLLLNSTIPAMLCLITTQELIPWRKSTITARAHSWKLMPSQSVILKSW